MAARYAFERSEPVERLAIATFDTLVGRIGPPTSSQRTATDMTRGVRARWKRLNQVLEIVSVQAVPGKADALGSSYWVAKTVKDDTASVAFNAATIADLAFADCRVGFRS